MQPLVIDRNRDFIGREHELARLAEIGASSEPAIVVVYGRRRVGKTELLEQAFRNRNILKFEGIRKLTEEEQKSRLLWQLSEYANNPLLAKLNLSTWSEIFKLIAEQIPEGTWTLYFEELQWLANYDDRFIAELKYAWDNYFRRKRGLILVLCGSSPSFMINHVLKSEALYNRSQHEIPLREFSLREAHQFLKPRSIRETMDAYLTIGGIPEYLKWINRDSSAFISLCKNAFTPGAFFSQEHERIFISSLADNPHYRKIIKFLAKKRFATRDEILKHLALKSSGAVSELLHDLSLCGFVEKYTPYNLNEDSLLSRYCIVDAYLQFYYKFIHPIYNQIANGDFVDDPASAVKIDVYYKWLAFAFERFCRRNHRLFAKILGFSAVHYRSGVFFNRSTDEEDSGYQIDLLYERDDRVITVCEIKYLQGKVRAHVINEVERKLDLFPNKKGYTLHKVLITSEGADRSLIARPYFDQIVTLADIINVH